MINYIVKQSNIIIILEKFQKAWQRNQQYSDP